MELDKFTEVPERTDSEVITGPVRHASWISNLRPHASGDGDRKLTAEEEEARRIAEMGKPVLGENCRLEVIIEESYDFKVIVLGLPFPRACPELCRGGVRLKKGRACQHANLKVGYYGGAPR